MIDSYRGDPENLWKSIIYVDNNNIDEENLNN